MMKMQQHEKDLIQMKSEFVDMASHQFRTPLTVIYANMELIEFQSKKMGEDIGNKLNAVSVRVKNEVERMIGLMNNVFLFGSYNNNEIKFNSKPVNLSKLMNKILASYFSNLTDGRVLKMTMDQIKGKVYLDEFLFTYMITTVISNALKYSNGRPDPTIAIVNNYPNYQIIVRDYGVGIPQEDQPKLFSSFYRASNVQTDVGSGLGLTIAKQFTELHGGKIEVNSTLNVGTEVILTLPYHNV